MKGRFHGTTDLIWDMGALGQLGLHVANGGVLGQVLTGDASLVAAGTPGSVTTTAGGTIAGTIDLVTPHSWIADGNGRYQTTADLKTEWQGYYSTMLTAPDHGASLTAWQRLEGNAEAVFENTALAQKSDTIQARDRADVQREFDAIAAAMHVDQLVYGTDPTKQFTAQTYLQLEHTIALSPVLLELGQQGHGLNNSGEVKYRGYTNDFQNGVDGVTLYIGGGLDNGQNALTDFFDDVVLSHAPFPTIWQNGHLEQLNQNANAEDTIGDAVTAFDNAAYDRVFLASDFSANPQAMGGVLSVGNAADPSLVDTGAAGASFKASATTTVWGTTELHAISGLTPHRWVAGADGLYHTHTDLKEEWQHYYQEMRDGHGANLTWWQRLEGNAEAVFENTALDHKSEAVQERDREDFQRELDAEVAAWKLGLQTGVLHGSDITEASYVQISHIIIGSPDLAELATQGHGLNHEPVEKYDGYTNDFQNGVDGRTNYVGGGLDNGENALTDFFDDVVLGHTPFPTVMKNGQFVQLNQNGAREDLVTVAAAALDQAANHRVYVGADFNTNAAATGPVLTLDTVADWLKQHRQHRA
jgi:hypothetical protein